MHKRDNFDYFVITALLIQKGFKYSHEKNFNTEVWHNSNNDRYFMVNRSSDKIPKADLQKSLEKAGLSIDKLLE